MELPSRASHRTDILCQVSTFKPCDIIWQTQLNISNSVLPGIAFSLDLIETTREYGVSEVLISSFMAAFIFSIFGAQPLTIAGVTGVPNPSPVAEALTLLTQGPITVFNKTIFTITQNQPDAPNYLQFMGWVYLWGAILHWITALLNCKQHFPFGRKQPLLTPPSQ